MATDINGGIAKHGNIPWHCAADMKLFRYITNGMGGKYKHNAVIMGYNTWMTLPKKPLSKRINIVISRNHFPAINVAADDAAADNAAANHAAADPNAAATANHAAADPNIEQGICTHDGALWFRSPQDFLLTVDPTMHYWLIAGHKLTTWFLDNAIVADIYHTLMIDNYDCDISVNLTRYPAADLNDRFITDTIIGVSELRFIYRYVPNKEEERFLNIIETVLVQGYQSDDRTGVGTRTIQFCHAEFDLSSHFPLMTTRPQPLRWIFEELMWILRGQRHTGILESKGINIWSANTTQEFLDKQNLDVRLEAGDIGESYGHNMRYYGTSIGNETQGYDQLANVIKLLRTDPNSRRIIINLWDPAAVKRAALPPCLFMYTFSVRRRSDGAVFLDCVAQNRSSDIAVAGMWNVSCAALLTYILAHLVGMQPGTLHWCATNVHIYNNNLDAARELIMRRPRVFPKLIIKRPLMTDHDILSLEYRDLQLIGYAPGAPLKFEIN